MRRSIFRKAEVKFLHVADRPLFDVGPNATVWMYPETIAPVEPGSIVWVKPPVTASAELIATTIKRLRNQGAHVKVLQADRVDDVVTEERAREAKPELSVSDAREVVYQLVRELAGPAGVPREHAIKVVDEAMDGAGI